MKKSLRVISLLLAMMILVSTTISFEIVFASEIDTTTLPTYEEAERTSQEYMKNVLPAFKLGACSDNLFDGSELTVGDEFSFSITQDMPSLEKYPQRWINAISYAEIGFAFSEDFDVNFRITDQNGNDVTDEVGTYYFETTEISDEEYENLLEENKEEMEKEIQNSIQDAIEEYEEFIAFETNFDELVEEARAELLNEYLNGGITEEEYIREQENLETQIVKIKEQIEIQREFYDLAGVTGIENIELAVRLQMEYKNKYTCMLFFGYEYYPQRISVFHFIYNTEYLKTHSGDTLTLRWDATVTDKSPVGTFYFNPLISYKVGNKALVIENKQLVWKGQQYYFILNSPIWDELLGESSDEVYSMFYYLYKKYTEVMPKITVYRPVTVNYLDENNEVIKTAIINQYENEYSIEPEEIYGYDIVEIPDNASGRINDENIEVNFICNRKNATVTVNHVDEEGNPLTESIIINGKVFDDYSTKLKMFYGYLTASVPENAEGQMTEDNIAVTYVYRKIFERLPAEPYKAVYGDKLSDIELPFGWVFDDVQLDPDTTVGEEGVHTFAVSVPADESHPVITGKVTIEVSKPAEEPQSE